MLSVKLYNDLNKDYPKIMPNDNIKISLKEHQKTAIHAMLKFEQNRCVSYTNIISDKTFNFEIESNYSILADKVGSGKTFIIMGLISQKQIPDSKPIISNTSLYTVVKYTDNIRAIKTNLIIVPHNLTGQWKEVFTYTTLKTYIISRKSDITNVIVDNYDCIIVSSTMIDDFYEKTKEIKWARVIIDEIITIKIPIRLQFNSNFIWFITATPNAIKNIKCHYIKKLTSMLTHESDEILNKILIKNNDDYVNESLQLPDINKIIIKCLSPKEYNILKDYVSTDIINMINAGNIEDAIKKLNCNTETTENILEVITRKIKTELYNCKEELSFEDKKIHETPKIKEEKIKKILSKIHDLELKYSGLEDRIKVINQPNDCPICYNLINTPIITNCCNNVFCIECLIKCKSCPLCRVKLEIPKCIVINENKIIKEQLYPKTDNLLKLIKDNPDRKILLFSEYDKTFDNLHNILTTNKITFDRLVGSCNHVNNVIKKFNEGNINILMLNAVNYGSGLNLQSATDIIIYHQLNKELESQVIGRAQRLGRNSNLNVYYLFYENENI